jgi:hypothetical protein
MSFIITVLLLSRAEDYSRDRRSVSWDRENETLSFIIISIFTRLFEKKKSCCCRNKEQKTAVLRRRAKSEKKIRFFENDKPPGDGINNERSNTGTISSSKNLLYELIVS